MTQPFERYPALAGWIEKLANTATGLSLGEWMVFVGALNAAISKAEAPWPIATDGPHEIGDHRRWLARQLMDGKLDDWAAYGAVAFHPAISDRAASSKTEIGGQS